MFTERISSINFDIPTEDAVSNVNSYVIVPYLIVDLNGQCMYFIGWSPGSMFIQECVYYEECV